MITTNEINDIFSTNSTETNSLFLCKKEFESQLMSEMHAKSSGKIIELEGAVLLTGELSEKFFIFEQQRIVRCGFIPLQQNNQLPDSAEELLFATLKKDPKPWAFHVYAAEHSPAEYNRKINGIAQFLLKKMSKNHPHLAMLERKPEKIFEKQNGLIIQLFLHELGIFYGTSSYSELSAQVVGGLYRMKNEKDAPSRSFMKVEEALSRMNYQFKGNEKIIDLGAAPGGWSYAFAKRGCFVISVDNGPMKLLPKYMQNITHIKEDGVNYTPPKIFMDADFLTADMLITPNKALFFLKKWLENRWVKNIIINIKIPQKDMYLAIAPIEKWLSGLQDAQLAIRHFYHDRREVTIYGKL